MRGEWLWKGLVLLEALGALWMVNSKQHSRWKRTTLNGENWVPLTDFLQGVLDRSSE